MKFGAILVLILGWFAPSFASDLPRFSVFDLQGKNQIACSLFISRGVGQFLDNPEGLISPQLASDALTYARKNKISAGDDLHQFQIGVVTMADLLDALPEDMRYDFLLWHPEGFKTFLSALDIEEKEIAGLLSAREFLREAGRAGVRWGKPAMVRGTDRTVLTLLGEIGVPYDQVAMLSTALTVLRNTQSDFALGDAQNALRAHNDHLVTCVTGKACRYVNGASNARAFFVPRSSNLEQVQQFAANRFQRIHFIGDSNGRITVNPVQEVGVDRYLDMMVLPFPDFSRGIESVLEWVETYYHESTHYADYILLSQWIRANRKLINRGQNPDKYFTDFVRIDIDPVTGKDSTAIKEDFLSIFLESRAYSTMMKVRWMLQPHHTVNNTSHEMDLKYRAVRQIQNGVPWSDLLKTRWKVTPSKNNRIFDVGNEIAEEMRQTILRSNEP